MKIQITSRKFKAKDPLKDYITDEIESLQKYHDEIMDVSVVLSFTNNDDNLKTVDVHLQIPGKILAVSETTDDFKKSSSIAAVKLASQLKKIKTKAIDSKRK